jgi:PPOX class probable F420-dependent enzyme
MITAGRVIRTPRRRLDTVANTATNDRVGREELTEFLRTRHHAIVVTRRKDGGEQTSPVTLGIDDQGRLLVSTYPERAKVHNIRRDPYVTMCVLSQDFNGPWVHVEGTAEVLDLPEALDPLCEYFRSISGEHSDWEEYKEAMASQGKCLVRLTVERWGPIATGGFPARLAKD